MLEYHFNGLPALFLSFSYDGIQIAPHKKRLVELKFKFEGNKPHFTIVKRAEEWEQRQAELLQELGLERKYENAF